MNHPQHQASVGHAILPHRSENVRMKLPRHPEPKPNKLENTSRGSNTILIAITPDLSSRVTPHGGLSSVAAPAGSCSPLSLLPGLFLNLQSSQDKNDRLRNVNPIIACQGVFSISKLLLCLAAHVFNHMSGVTQGVGSIDHKRGIFTQDQKTGAGGVRCGESRKLA